MSSPTRPRVPLIAPPSTQGKTTAQLKRRKKRSRTQTEGTEGVGGVGGESGAGAATGQGEPAAKRAKNNYGGSARPPAGSLLDGILGCMQSTTVATGSTDSGGGAEGPGGPVPTTATSTASVSAVAAQEVDEELAAERAANAQFRAAVRDIIAKVAANPQRREFCFKPAHALQRYIIREEAEEAGLEAASYPTHPNEDDLKTLVLYQKDSAPSEVEIERLKDAVIVDENFFRPNHTLELIQQLLEQDKEKELQRKRHEEESKRDEALEAKYDYRERFKHLTDGFDELKQVRTVKRDLRTIEEIQMDKGMIRGAAASTSTTEPAEGHIEGEADGEAEGE